MKYIYKIIATKSMPWNYEKEMRFEPKRKYDPNSLIEIVIGEKMPLDQQKLVVHTATKANPNIKVKLAKLKANSYGLEIVDYSI
jgi:transposase-like protein